MEKKTDEYFRREVKSFIKEFFESLMLDELKQHLELRPDDKGNGFYDRDLTTSMARVEGLKVPRTRSGEFNPAILPERRRASFDLEELVFAMHVGGSSTRDISKFIERVYSASLGRDAISRLTDVAQGVIDKWKNRPLAKEYAVIFLDATYVKLRRGDVRSEPVYIAMGVLPNGDRQILGFTMFGSEGESAGAWHEYLLKLKERGVKSVKLFVTDNLRGLTQTTARVFPESQYQLCVVHQVRNCLRDTRASDKAELAQDMKTIYRADILQHRSRLTALHLHHECSGTPQQRDQAAHQGDRGVQHGAQPGENVVFNIARGRRKAFKTQNAERWNLGGQTQLTGHYHKGLCRF
jgi:transposase-like protein